MLLHMMLAGAAQAVPVAAAPTTDPAAIEARADALIASALSDAPEAFIAALDPAFLTMIGGPDGVRALGTAVRTQAGTLGAPTLKRSYHEEGVASVHRLLPSERMGPVRVEIALADAGGRVVGFAVRPAPPKPPAATATTRFRLPFGAAPAGTGWYVQWGGETPVENYHDRPETAYAFDFAPRPLGGGPTTASVAGAPCWGQPILAAAAGRVVAARDGIADEMTLGRIAASEATMTGNHVLIEHAPGEVSLSAHLRQGSVAVKVGDMVAAGQRIGLCGNSGATTTPHLHWQVMDRADIATAKALKVRFVGYRDQTGPRAEGSPVRGDTVAPGD